MDKKDFEEFEEFKKWKKEKEKEKNSITLKYRPSPLLNTRIGIILSAALLLTIVVGIIVVGIMELFPKNKQTQPDAKPLQYELNSAEKFLVGKWKIHDIGFADSLPENGQKAYTTDERLTQLWEMAQNYGFIFDGTISEDSQQNSTNVYLRASGRTSTNLAFLDIDSVSTQNMNYNVFARTVYGDGSLNYYFTHDPSDTTAYNNLDIPNSSRLSFFNYYNDTDTSTRPINSVVAGKRAESLTEKDTLRMTLIPAKSTDKVLWYEFERV